MSTVPHEEWVAEVQSKPMFSTVGDVVTTGMFKKVTGQTPSFFQREQDIKRNAIRSNPLLFVPNCFAETIGWTK
jgi:uncharacterized protein (UPF0218 family)